jgi:hypothetical protein
MNTSQCVIGGASITLGTGLHGRFLRLPFETLGGIPDWQLNDFNTKNNPGRNPRWMIVNLP